MKATIRHTTHTTHANLKPGDPVEVTGYCAKVTATFDDATPNAKAKTEERTVFFDLLDLTLCCRGCGCETGPLAAILCEECSANQRQMPGLVAHPAKPRGGYSEAEIPADLPKPAPTPAQLAKPPTIAPQNEERAYLAYLPDILNALRDIYEILNNDIETRDARRRGES